MSTAAMAQALPQAAGSRRALAVGLACSVGFNLLVILALASMTGVHRAQEDPPAVMHFQHVPPPPPPPPPPPEPKAQPEVQPDTVLPPLPQLDVPDVASDSLVLPAMAADSSLVSLPVGIPGFTTQQAAGPAGGVSFNEAFDEPPSVTTPLDLDHFYPTQARLRGIQGESSISLHVDHRGEIVSWSITASTPPGIFEQALDRMVHSLRITPAKRAGVPIASTLRLRFKWTLNR